MATSDRSESDDYEMPDESRRALLDLIAQFLRVVSEPTAEDLAHGWTRENRATVTAIIEDMRNRLHSGIPIAEREKRPSIARDLDELGISGGPLLERVSRIGNLYWDTDLTRPDTEPEDDAKPMRPLGFKEALLALQELAGRRVLAIMLGLAEETSSTATLSGVLKELPLGRNELPDELSHALGDEAISLQIGDDPDNCVTLWPQRFVEARLLDDAIGIEIRTKDGRIRVLSNQPWID